ncbi:MAG: Na(+)/H(+) antiporter subunit B, partial [Ignisphaera sp.]|nr:Na(+)/H(+) antiporter subunit B [Ignisphaera sp.]
MKDAWVRDAVFIALIIFAIAILVVPTLLGALGPMPPPDVRYISMNYLNNTYNQFNQALWASSPEAVAAIIWDYRGLDTLFETAVFYAAIIAALALYREILGEKDVLRGRGLSVVVQRSTAISMVGILVVGFATVLHGQLTPGGGFQGGAIAAVTTVVAIVVFSRSVMDRSRLSYKRLLVIRNAALICIALTAIIPIASLVFGNQIVFVFQNQAKAVSNFSYPQTVADVPMGGSIWFYNLFEGLAVVSAFSLAIMIVF